LGHWHLFFRSKGSRPAHLSNDANAPLRVCPYLSKKLPSKTVLH
jgi:hypothetical protein